MMLKNVGYDLEESYIRRIFKSWRWSWKKPIRKQFHKYSSSNLRYYGDFLSFILGFPDWTKLKFIDEVHFVGKGNVSDIYCFFEKKSLEIHFQ